MVVQMVAVMVAMKELMMVELWVDSKAEKLVVLKAGRWAELWAEMMVEWSAAAMVGMLVAGSAVMMVELMVDLWADLTAVTKAL